MELFTSAGLAEGEAFVSERVWGAICDGTLRVEAASIGRGTRFLVLRGCSSEEANALTHRERQIVDRIAAGDCPTVVGFDLGISGSTVATHLASALHKLTQGSRLRLYEAWALVHQTGARLIHVAGEACWILVAPLQPWPGSNRLTPAQLAVVDCLMNGLSNAEIAAARNVSIRTVANQLAAVFQRLQIADRNDLALLVLSGRPRDECKCA
ncbi:MAG: hypothetical protein KC766_29865 [Myxococcales bacterium]|nr:hypothetical protein [Myxococcales bacterium]